MSARSAAMSEVVAVDGGGTELDTATDAGECAGDAETAAPGTGSVIADTLEDGGGVAGAIDTGRADSTTGACERA